MRELVEITDPDVLSAPEVPNTWLARFISDIVAVIRNFGKKRDAG